MFKKSVTCGLSVLVAVVMVCGAAQAQTYSPNGSIVNGIAGGALTPYQANSTAPELYADTMVASVAAQRQFREALPSIHSYSQTAHMVSGNYCAPGNNWVMWDTPFAFRENRKRHDNYLGYKTTVSGFATGISRMLGETTAIGLAIGYDYRKFDARDEYYMKNRGDTFHAALYGGTAIGCFFVDAYAGYSRTWNRTRRDVARIASPSANFNDTVLSAGVKASYVWILPNEVRITSSLGLDYSYARQGKINEKGGIDTLHFTVDKSKHNFLQMPIMAAANKTFSGGNFLKFGGFCSLWTPEIRAGWIPQFGSKRTSIDAANSYGDATFKSSSVGNSHGLVGAGVKIKLRDKYIFAVDYNYKFASKYDNHIVTATYGVSF